MDEVENVSVGKIGQALAVGEIFDLVQDDLRRVEAEISLESMGSAEAVSAISRHLGRNGGKRLRPILVLLTSRLVGKPGDNAIKMAAVVEMLHTATLVHDDVIDNANTRRGKPSANSIWGNHAAVLAGDWLYMQAFQMALRERNFHVLDLLIGLTQMMVEGELLQLERIGHIDISEADYMELVDRKTASLFSACAKLGAITAGADEAVELQLGEFAWNLGMAFQLVDDVLDFTADEGILGKPVGNDLQEGKVTLPIIYALESASRSERALLEQALHDGTYERVSFLQVRAVLERNCGILRARQRAQLFTDRARLILSQFPESPAQRALFSATELITGRQY